MTYKIQFRERAQDDLVRLHRSERAAFEKAQRLIDELKEHPRTGTGHPEQLKGEPHGRWSRRITQKHRLVYEIHDTEVVVILLTAYGHYEDK